MLGRRQPRVTVETGSRPVEILGRRCRHVSYYEDGRLRIEEWVAEDLALPCDLTEVRSLTGDFSNTVFPDRSVDCVFTNSLDHAFDIDMVLAEVGRVLKPSGLFMTELALGLDEGPAAGDFESCFWKTRTDVTDHIRGLGYDDVAALDISLPFRGTHYVFRRSVRPVQSVDASACTA